MILLDIGTVLFSYVVSNAICLAVIASLWSQERQRSPGLGFWLADFAMQFVGLLLIALRGFIPTLSILLGSPLIITGNLLLYMGLEWFVGKRTPQIVNYILLAMLVAAHGYFSLVQPSLPARNIVLSMGLFIFSAQAAWLMLQRVDTGLQRHTKIVGAIFVLYCLVSILRIGVDLGVPQTNDIFKSGQYDVLAILIYEMLSISLVFALYSLVNKRLLAELKNDQVSLQDSETRYRSLFENMLNGFAYCQMLYKDGKPDDFVYLAVNDAFEKLTGLKNVAGKKVSQVIPSLKISDPELFEIYGRVALTSEPKVFETYVTALKMWFSVSVYSPQKGYFVAVFDVITERKESEKALRDSEDKFKYVFDYSTVGKSITLPTGDLHVNKAFCDMLGYSEEELEGLKWQEITHPDDIDLNKKEIAAVLAGEKGSFHFVKRYLHKDGSVVWADVSSSLRRDEAGKPIYFITTVIDITERKQAEEALRLSEENFSRAFNSSPAALSITRLVDGKIISINKAYTRVLGYALDEIFGRTTTELNIYIHPDERKNLVKILRKKGFARDFETTVRHKDGTARNILVSMESILYDNEKCILTSFIDLTDRKQAEEIIKQNEMRLNYSLLSADIGAWELNLQDKTAWRSLKHDQIFGYDTLLPEWTLGVFLEHVLPEDREQVQQKFDHALATRSEWDFECRVRHKSGDVRWIWARGNPEFNELGEPVKMFGIVQDITSRKQIEENRRLHESRYRELVQNANSAIIRWKSDGTITFINEYAEKFFGYRSDEIIGKDINILVPEKESTGGDLTSLVRDILTYPDKFKNVINENICRDGRRVWMAWTNRPVFDENGQVSEILAVGGDLTALRQAQESLQQNEERFREIFEHMSSGVVVFEAVKGGKDFRITNFNKAAEEIESISRDMVIGKLVTEAFPGVKEFGLFDVLRQVWKTGEPVRMPIGFYKDNRITGWRENYMARLPSGEILTVYDNVTERKQAEEALLESESRFRIVFENANDAVFIENEKDEIVSVNQRACEMMGYSREQLLTMRVSDLQALANRRKGSVLKTEMQEHGNAIFEGMNLRSDGSLIPIEVSVGKVERSSGDLYISIVRDITDRKAVEAELALKADELRSSSEELARLYRASGSLISAAFMSTQDLAQKIVEVVQNEFGQDNCSLFVPEKDSNELIRLATAGPYSDQVRNAKLTLDGEGLVVQAFKTGKTINVADVRADLHYVSNWDAARSEMAIPLKIGDNVIGVVDVQSPEMNAFSPDDERLMTIFAERAALGLEHSRLNTRMEGRIQQLTALRTVDMAISGSFDINLTLGILLDQVLGQLQVDAADVLVFNAATQNFRLACERGFHDPMPQHTQLNHGMGYAWRVVRERRMIHIPNIQAEPTPLPRSPDLSGETFTSYIGMPLIAKGQIRGVLEIFHRSEVKIDSDWYEFLELLTGQAAIAIDNIELFDKLQTSNSELNLAYNSTLEGWASALELRDQETGGHTRRTTELTIKFAQAMGIKESEMVNIYRGTLLHDIGKMGVPDSVVLKPGPLTDEEWVIMRKHPQYAYDLLSPIPYLRQALDIPYCRHEKWDGSGYPRGLKAEQIPLAARIFAVVDVYDALTSTRPYRGAWPKKDAVSHIKEQSGKHFDPRVVDLFLREMQND